MTLLITVFAAVVCTILWYLHIDSGLKLGNLCLIYWGAALMWLVDAIFAYAQLQTAYFTPTLQDMINDTYLGASVVALGLIIWLIHLLYKDPEGRLNGFLHRNSEGTNN